MKSKHVSWLIAAIAALAIFISCGCTRPRSPKEKQIPKTDTIEQIAPPTVQEVLQWRENLRLDKYVDSVFLVMPEQILTQILVIKRSMDIQKEYIPDSMPRSSLPQPNCDSIHVAVH